MASGVHSTTPSFAHKFWNFNSGPQACKASALLTGSLLSLESFFFILSLFWAARYVTALGRKKSSHQPGRGAVPSAFPCRCSIREMSATQTHSSHCREGFLGTLSPRLGAGWKSLLPSMSPVHYLKIWRAVQNACIMTSILNISVGILYIGCVISYDEYEMNLVMKHEY